MDAFGHAGDQLREVPDLVDPLHLVEFAVGSAVEQLPQFDLRVPFAGLRKGQEVIDRLVPRRRNLGGVVQEVLAVSPAVELLELVDLRRGVESGFGGQIVGHVQHDIDPLGVDVAVRFPRPVPQGLEVRELLAAGAEEVPDRLRNFAEAIGSMYLLKGVVGRADRSGPLSRSPLNEVPEDFERVGIA